jgi:hypothetical protein
MMMMMRMMMMPLLPLLPRLHLRLPAAAACTAAGLETSGAGAFPKMLQSGELIDDVSWETSFDAPNGSPIVA